MSDEFKRDLLEIVDDDRFDKSSTLITSQRLSTAGMSGSMNPTLADAILDRLDPQRLPARSQGRVDEKEQSRLTAPARLDDRPRAINP